MMIAQSKGMTETKCNCGIKRLLLLTMAAITCTLSAVAQVAVGDSIKVLYPEDGGSAITSPSTRHSRQEPQTPLYLDEEDSLDVTISKLQPMSGGKQKRQKKNWQTWRPDVKRALWLAIVIPGGGQIYNRKYWKLPIFYGGFVGCIYAMTWNNQMYKDYAQAYMDLMDDNPDTHSYDQFMHLGNRITEANMSRYQELFRKRKNRYRRWRDLATFVTIGVYALSIIDAYVDASLSDFDISEDLSLHVAPRIINGGMSSDPIQSSAIGIGASLKF